MVNSIVNSPNSTLEVEDTIKLNSSIISSTSASDNYPNTNINNDQMFQFGSTNTPFNPLPPPPISIHSSSSYHNHHHQKQPISAPSSSSNPHLLSQSLRNSEFFGNEFSMPNSSHYSIFSNQQAMNSLNSFNNEFSTVSNFQPPQSIFQLSMDSTSDILNEYSISNPQSADLMYNVSEFEVGNASFESIPDSIHNQSRSFDINDSSNKFHNYPQKSSQPHDFIQYPYTPTISDVYTPTVSDASSFTPTSAVNEEHIREPIPISLNQSYYKNNHTSTTPPLSISHKITKKPSFSRLNNSSIKEKKNLVISTQISHANTPLSEHSPQVIGISPLCNKYKGLEIHSTNSLRSVSNNSNASNSIMPPMNIFRHNSDSSTSSYYSRNDENTPKRKTYPSLSEVSSQQSLKKPISRKASKNSILDSQSTNTPESTTKLKKYTRRRLLPRSKSGCWICRIKHLKCDEFRPVCTSCSKFGIECDYSLEKPDYVIDKSLRKEKLFSISIIRKQKQADNKKNKLKQESV